MPKPFPSTKHEQESANRCVGAAGTAHDGHLPPPLNGETSTSADVTALLKQLGITVVQKAVYEWGGYRYSNPTDAISAARRGVPQ